MVVLVVLHSFQDICLFWVPTVYNTLIRKQAFFHTFAVNGTLTCYRMLTAFGVRIHQIVL